MDRDLSRDATDAETVVEPNAATPGANGPGFAGRASGVIVTSLIVVGPLVAILLVVIGLWGRHVSYRDLALLVALYAVSCLGVTAGYHRLFTHRSFVAKRGLKIAARDRGVGGVRGIAHQLGGEPPPPPPVLGSGGGSALPRPRANRGRRVRPRPRCTPTSGGCSGPSRPTSSATRPISSPTAT